MSRMPDITQKPSGQPRVKMPDGRVIKYPTHGMMIELAPRDALGAVVGNSQIRARTWQDGVRDVSEYVAKALGIDLDEMYALKNRGIMIGMIPLVPSGIGKKFVDSGISRVVSPNDVKPRRGMFHSFFADEGGNLHDLGDLTHDASLAKINELPEVMGTEGDWAGKVTGYNLQAALEKNKLMRLQVAPGDIAIENHHLPTPHQIDAISQLVESNPKAKFSYDLFNGETNEFKNGVAGFDLMDKIISFYYGVGERANKMWKDIANP